MSWDCHCRPSRPRARHELDEALEHLRRREQVASCIRFGNPKVGQPMDAYKGTAAGMLDAFLKYQRRRAA